VADLSRTLSLFQHPAKGSGKSNFLDALRFLIHSMHAPLEQVIDARSGPQSTTRNVYTAGELLRSNQLTPDGNARHA